MATQLVIKLSDLSWMLSEANRIGGPWDESHDFGDIKEFDLTDKFASRLWVRKKAETRKDGVYVCLEIQAHGLRNDCEHPVEVIPMLNGIPLKKVEWSRGPHAVNGIDLFRNQLRRNAPVIRLSVLVKPDQMDFNLHIS